MAAKAFIPIEVTDEILIESNISEDDAPPFDSTIIYSEGQLMTIIDKNKHLVYESLQDNNQGHPPHLSTTWWILKGYTNRWAMFEWNQGEPSKSTSPLTVTVRPGQRIDSLMLDGLKGTLLDITVRNGLDGKIASSLDGYLVDREVLNWFDFFFAPFVYSTKVAWFEIPPINDPVITLTLSDPSGVVEIGRFAFGLSIELGEVEWSPVSDADNYSEVVWDDFGKATLTPIPSIPLIDEKIFVARNRVNLIKQFRDQANAKAAVWAGLTDINYGYTESLILFGVYTNFKIDISNHDYALVSLSLKGI